MEVAEEAILLMQKYDIRVYGGLSPSFNRAELILETAPSTPQRSICLDWTRGRALNRASSSHVRAKPISLSATALTYGELVFFVSLNKFCPP
ncbi:hypothetical protein EVAR_53224_1 [Eumeta japonica]|uniref:Uncharacterized protein n=1 Tax=Eumeta variegata TaxID=151549 RepID=A0A4C1XG81_EUMVA|nr:hypothetical protein EVAR_53224_1 [Eumeta japonica]